MDRSKRNFIKKAIAGVGITIVGSTVLSQFPKNSSQGIFGQPNQEEVSSSDNNHNIVPDDPQRHWGFLIDISKCDGCENLDSPEEDPTGEKPRCSYACRKSHYYLSADPPQYWIRVYKQQENPHASPFNFPKPCMNCENPPCGRVCPTGATFKRKDGTVLINHRICIGCRFCMAACPYETRFFWYWEPTYKDEDEKQEVKEIGYSPEQPLPHIRGTVVKCDYCLHMAYNGQLPSCITACPRGALYYGDLNEDAVSNGHEIIPLRKTLEDSGGYRYKEEEHTNPSVFYLQAGFREESSNTSEGNIGIEFLPSKTPELVEIQVSARSNVGSPLKSARIKVYRETFAGRLFVAEGKTDSEGTFKCSFYSPRLNGQKITAELVSTNQIKGSMVRKHVE